MKKRSVCVCRLSARQLFYEFGINSDWPVYLMRFSVAASADVASFLSNGFVRPQTNSIDLCRAQIHARFFGG